MVTLYPAAGYREQISGALINTDVSGYAWSCVVTGANAHYLGFYSTVVNPTSGSYRAHSFPVRCVQHLLLLERRIRYLRVQYILADFLIGIARATAFASVS
ncbi:MAG: hypothetical protein LBU44_00755, partial [Mediterranea sp.]|nr:hypothetical protein [Mediterranea sp.]